MKNLKIKSKLFILTLILLIALVGVGVSALMFMDKINEVSTEITNESMPSVIAAEELNTHTSDFRIKEYKHIIAQTPAEMSEAEAEMNELQANIDEQISIYNGLITNDTDKAMIDSIVSLWDEYLRVHDSMVKFSNEYQTDLAMSIMSAESATIYNEVSNTCLELVEFNKEGAEQASKDGDATYDTAKNITIGVLIAVIILSLALSVYIIRSITKPVGEIDKVARKIAEGNLDEEISYKSKDELGMLAGNFNKTVDRLRDYIDYIDEIADVLNQIANGKLGFKLTYEYAGEFSKIKTALLNISRSLNDTMSQINQSSEQVASGSGQVSSGAQALSQGATEQAASVEELAATINEISAQIKETATSAIDAREKTNTAGNEITVCNQQMQDMILAMSEISDKSNEIGKIIKTIEDIAFQTNILALNAAVEAARAGEAGKGFAVVADEVRNLANKSQEASKNTSGLIEGSIQAVEKGTKIANETAESLLHVVDATQMTVETVDKIAVAANEQVSSMNEVTIGIDQISGVVQMNSATAEESAAASEELSGQAQILRELVDRFELTSYETSSLSENVANTERKAEKTPEVKTAPETKKSLFGLGGKKSEVAPEKKEAPIKPKAPAAPAKKAAPVKPVAPTAPVKRETSKPVAPAKKEAAAKPEATAAPIRTAAPQERKPSGLKSSDKQFDDPVNDKY